MNDSFSFFQYLVMHELFNHIIDIQNGYPHYKESKIKIFNLLFS